MARPMKEGVDYFPLDVVMDTDVQLLEAQFGVKAFAVYIKLLQYIYGSHGYYGEWSEDIGMLFSRSIGEDRTLVSDIVQAAIRRGLFDEAMYKKYRILTSHGIQKRYFEMTKRRQVLEIRKEYLLVHGVLKKVNARINAVNVDNNSKNACSGTQSKVKERKVKKSRVKNTYTSDSADVVGADAPHFDYQLYIDYWNHHVAEPTGIASVRKAAHWSSARKKNLRARVKAEGAKTVLAVFDMVSDSDWLSGRSGDWQADFDWVIKPANFQKIVEGKYKNRQQAAKETFYDKLARGGR